MKPFPALLFTMMIWGLAPVFIRSLSVDLGAADHLVIRYSLVAVLYLAGLAVMGGWRIERADWPRLAAISLVGALILAGVAFAQFASALRQVAALRLAYCQNALRLRTRD